ncbi:MAG TPA: GAF domain-containing protein [Anaerolineae bacterium]|nr:GAF domain-containing protein [Anaerolineae bacterium]
MTMMMVSGAYIVLVVLVVLGVGVVTQWIVRGQTKIDWGPRWAWGSLGVTAVIHTLVGLYDAYWGLDWNETLIVALAFEIAVLAFPIIVLYRKDVINDFWTGTLYGAYSGMGLGLAKWILIALEPEWIEESLVMTQQELIIDGLRIAFYGAEDAVYFGVVGALLGFTIGLLSWQNLERKLFSLMAGFCFALLWSLQSETLISVLFDAGLDNEAEFMIFVSSVVGLGLVIALLNIAKLAVEKQRAEALLEVVIPLGVQLSSGEALEDLLRDVVQKAQNFCQARVGLLVMMEDDKQLEMMALRFPQKRIFWDRDKIEEMGMGSVSWAKNYMLTQAILDDKVMEEDAGQRIPFVSEIVPGFVWTHSLTIPLKKEGEMLGVLQLFDPRNENFEVVPFDTHLQTLLNSYAELSCAVLLAYRNRLEVERAGVVE